MPETNAGAGGEPSRLPIEDILRDVMLVELAKGKRFSVSPCPKRTEKPFAQRVFPNGKQVSYWEKPQNER
jgi:hypothetical protein